MHEGLGATRPRKRQNLSPIRCAVRGLFFSLDGQAIDVRRMFL